jgi:hypothetical protein
MQTREFFMRIQGDFRVFFYANRRKPLIVLGFPGWESENFSSKRYVVYMIVCILLPSKYLSKSHPLSYTQ